MDDDKTLPDFLRGRLIFCIGMNKADAERARDEWVAAHQDEDRMAILCYPDCGYEDTIPAGEEHCCGPELLKMHDEVSKLKAAMSVWFDEMADEPPPEDDRVEDLRKKSKPVRFDRAEEEIYEYWPTPSSYDAF